MPPLEMIKISRDEYDRLVELSPFMPMAVIKEFNSKFNKNKHIDLTKPEICDELASTVVFQLTDEERLELMNKNDKKKDENPKEAKRKAIIQKKVDTKIEKFKQTFYSLNNRYPTADEISKNMSKFVDSIPEEEIINPSDDIECNEIVIDQLTTINESDEETTIKETIINETIVNDVPNKNSEFSAKIILDIDSTQNESNTDSINDNDDNNNVNNDNDDNNDVNDVNDDNNNIKENKKIV